MYLLSTSTCFLFQLDFVGFESEPFEYAYEAKDVILYNLGVGASLSQANGVDLLYEGSENFGALTSFGVIPAMGGLSGLITGKVPGLQIDLAKVNLLMNRAWLFTIESFSLFRYCMENNILNCCLKSFQQVDF